MASSSSSSAPRPRAEVASAPAAARPRVEARQLRFAELGEEIEIEPEGSPGRHPRRTRAGSGSQGVESSQVGDGSQALGRSRRMSRRKRGPTIWQKLRDPAFLIATAKRWGLYLWDEVALELWTPMLGLLAVGSAFDAQIWLAILDLLVGIPLLHARAWQDWVGLSCAFQGKAMSWSNAELFCSGCAVAVSLVTLLYGVATNAGTAGPDVLYVVFALGGIGTTLMRPEKQATTHMQPEMPVAPVLVLLGTSATLSPSPAVASLPYALLFLVVLGRYIFHLGLRPLRFWARVGLLLLTAAHLFVLLVMSIWAQFGGAPNGLTMLFGPVGRTLTTRGASCDSISQAGDDRCNDRAESNARWTGVHVTSLLLLYFALTNISKTKAKQEDGEEEEDESEETDEELEDEGHMDAVPQELGIAGTIQESPEEWDDQERRRLNSSHRAPNEEEAAVARDWDQERARAAAASRRLFHTEAVEAASQAASLASQAAGVVSQAVSDHSDGRGMPIPMKVRSDDERVKAWAARAVRLTFSGALFVFAVHFPSVLTVPIFLDVFAWSQPSRRLAALCRRLLRLCCRRAAMAEYRRPQSKHWFASWKFFLFVYAVLVFLVDYVYNIAVSGPWPRPLSVLPHDLELLNRLGLHDYRSAGGPGASAWAFFERVLLLSLFAVLKVFQHILAHGLMQRRRMRMLHRVADLAHRAWLVVRAVNPSETSMAITLVLVLSALDCERGFASIFVISYVIVLVGLIVSQTDKQAAPIHWRWWFAMQSCGEVACILIMFAYVLDQPLTKGLLTPMDPVLTMTACKSLVALIAPHMGIFLCAALQLECLDYDAARAAFASGDSAVEAVPTTMSTVDASFFVTFAYFRKFDFDIWKQRCIRLLEEGLFLAVMNVSVFTALLPPTDIHSLVLLVVVGPSLLFYNFDSLPTRRCFMSCSKNSHVWHQLRALRVLRYLAALFFLVRAVASSPMVPLQRLGAGMLSLEELGIGQPLEDPPIKYAMLATTAIMARLGTQLLGIKEGRLARKGVVLSVPDDKNDYFSPTLRPRTDTDGTMGSSQMSHMMLGSSRNSDCSMPTPSASLAAGAGAAHKPPTGHVVSLTAEPGDSLPPTDSVLPPADGTGREDFGGILRPSIPATELMSDQVQAEVSDAGLLTGSMPMGEGPSDNAAPTLRWEERFLERWAPPWAPAKAHSYLSVVLLFVTFSVSSTEVHLLNFVMISSVVGLCGWSKHWVLAGDIFAVTTVAIMILQYIFRFHAWSQLVGELAIQEIGLHWSLNQVLRHYLIFILCLVQKQLSFRSRRSKPREPACPPWLARHADIVGIMVLLVVAVARRHAWATLLALAALPWLAREELPWLQVEGSQRGEARTKWLRFFRFVLLVMLLFQLVTQLSISFKVEKAFDPIFRKLCEQLWQDKARDTCVHQWHRWTQIENNGGGAQLLWEFLALFVLGYIQQLLGNMEAKRESTSLKRWKLVIMYWWPGLVWGVTFALSLEGGNILGIANLAMLLGNTLSADRTLEARRRWVWRTRLSAWVFLVFGLLVQSPGLPCSRAACAGFEHRTYIEHDACFALEALNMTIVATTSNMVECKDFGADAIGHDTWSTLALQVVGLRRVVGDGFIPGLRVLLTSQLGGLLILIFVTTVQLRIFNSPTYRNRLEDCFINEPFELKFMRADRYVKEFYCRCGLEKDAQQERHKALRRKLKRIMTKINEILTKGPAANEKTAPIDSKGKPGDTKLAPTPEVLGGDDVREHRERFARTGVNETAKQERMHTVLEEIQLSHGVTKDVAARVTSIFENDVSASKYYLDLLHLVAVGRLMPQSTLLEVLVEKLIQRVRAERRHVEASMSVAKVAKKRGPMPLSPPSQTAFWDKANEIWQKTKQLFEAGLRGILSWWTTLKYSPTFAVYMWDYAFLGVNEEDFSLRDHTKIAEEELHLHRMLNGPLRLLWKFALSQMANLAAIAAVLAFMQTRSLLDLFRAFAIFFIGLRQYPFPPKFLWSILKGYSAAILVARALYELPVLCSGFSLRWPMSAAEKQAYTWEPDGVFAWCTLAPPGADVTVGVAKRTGPSAWGSYSWLAVVWADHLCVWSIILHQWMLVRSGVWNCVTVDAATQRLVLKPEALPPPEDQDVGEGEVAHVPKSMATGRGFSTFNQGTAATAGAADTTGTSAAAAGGAGTTGTAAATGTTATFGGGTANFGGGTATFGRGATGAVGTTGTFGTTGIPALAHSSRQVMRGSGLGKAPGTLQLDLQKEDGVANFEAIHEKLVTEYVKRREHYIKESEETMRKLRKGAGENKEQQDNVQQEGEPDANSEAAPSQQESFEDQSPSINSQRSKSSLWTAEGRSSMFMHAVGGNLSETLQVRLGLQEAPLLQRLAGLLAWAGGTQQGNQTHAALLARLEKPGPGEDIEQLVEAIRRQRAARLIQRCMIPWVMDVRQRIASRDRIRCSMGHKLTRYQAERQGRDRKRRGGNAQAFEDLCERCYKVIQALKTDHYWWSCKTCDYHVCDDCVGLVLEKGKSMGKQAESIKRGATKPGVPLYWLKYVCGLFLLVYAMVGSKSLLNEERSFSESIKANSFGIETLLLLVLHLVLLVYDRIWHKLYYRNAGSTVLTDAVNLLVHLFLFAGLHAYIINSVTAGVTNNHNVEIPLYSSPWLSGYYVMWMLYMSVCMLQHCHGLPAVDTEMLRPMEFPESQGYITEKLQMLYFLVHYNLPFVDDLRVLIDWTVVRTSLDLWMYFKVEDAHTWLYRIRHMMFVRRQSFFAEERDWMEKLYSGWFLLVLLIAIILMPIIIFSPITPFPNSVPIESALATLRFRVSSACGGYLSDGSCRTTEVILHRAAANQLWDWSSNQSMRDAYFAYNRDAATDADIQEVVWDGNSDILFDVSPPNSAEVSRQLSSARPSGAANSIQVSFTLEVSVVQTGLGQVTLPSTQVCACMPQDACASNQPTWPPGITRCSAPHADQAGFFSTVQDWWANLANRSNSTSSTQPPLLLDSMWASAIRIKTGLQAELIKRHLQPILSPKSSSSDQALSATDNVTDGLLYEMKQCGAGAPPYTANGGQVWCTEAHRWGSLSIVGNRPLRITFELDRATRIGIQEGSSYGSVIGLYLGLVFVVGRYLRAAFQDSSKRCIYEEIPDVSVFLDLVTAVKLAREHGDLRTEFQLYYELMKVLRSTDLLLTAGGHEVTDYGVFRVDACPPECAEPGKINWARRRRSVSQMPAPAPPTPRSVPSPSSAMHSADMAGITMAPAESHQRFSL